MSSASYPQKLRASIKAAAQRLAREDGVSLDQWIAIAVAQKVGAIETTANFLERKAGDAEREDMFPFLDKARDETPARRDELN